MIVNQEDPVKARLVDDRISSLLAQANLVIARQVARTGSDYLDLILNGGHFDFFGQSFQILGLKSSARILQALRPVVPPECAGSLDEVTQFAALARDNLDLAGPLLNSVAQPIEVQKTVISGETPPLDIFAIAVAATFTLMFVTVLLVSGSLALEREENVFARLTRGLVSRSGLLVEKVGLGVGGGTGRDPADAGRPRALRQPRLGTLRPLGDRDRRPAGPASPPPAQPWARSPGRSAPLRCWPSWSRSRSPCSRWSPRARSASGLYDVIRAAHRAVPVQAGAERDHLRAGRERLRPRGAAASPRRPDPRLRPARPGSRCAASPSV